MEWVALDDDLMRAGNLSPFSSFHVVCNVAFYLFCEFCISFSGNSPPSDANYRG